MIAAMIFKQGRKSLKGFDGSDPTQLECALAAL